MATNYSLLSSNSSSSDSSSTDDDLATSRKIDLSYHNLDDKNLEVNLVEVLSHGEGIGERVEKLLAYNNRLEMFSDVLAAFSNLSVLVSYCVYLPQHLSRALYKRLTLHNFRTSAIT